MCRPVHKSIWHQFQGNKGRIYYQKLLKRSPVVKDVVTAQVRRLFTSLFTFTHLFTFVCLLFQGQEDYQDDPSHGGLQSAAAAAEPARSTTHHHHTQHQPEGGIWYTAVLTEAWAMLPESSSQPLPATLAQSRNLAHASLETAVG